jgi:hypothetical protein
MAIDDRADGLWAVTTDKDGNIVQTNLYTDFKITSRPGEADTIQDPAARSAAQIQEMLSKPKAL